MSGAIRNPHAASLLALAIGLATMPTTGAAQQHATHPPVMPTASMPDDEADKQDAAPADDETNAEQVDHSTMDHSAMGHDMPKQTVPEEPVDHSTMDHSAMGHAMPSQTVPAEAVDHSTMDHSAMGHDMPKQPPAEKPVDHSIMDHSAMGHDADSPAPLQPRTPIPVLTDADRAAAVPPAHDHPVHDNTIQHYLLFNRLEAWDASPGLGTAWEAQGWVGTDLNRMWLRSEGERVDGHTEGADLEILYGRSVARWWDVVAGIRHDFKPAASQDFLAVGLIGLAPYKFEVQATAYLGESGRSEASIEVEYETLLTNRLILQPLVEISVFGQDDEQRGVGSGLGTVEAGLRLRYEVTRRFAPYVGLVHERAFGRTAQLRREEGEPRDDTRLVAGVRLWF